MRFEAPAKLNFSLLVGPRDEGGLHPVQSLVQAIDWVDELVFVTAEGDDFEVEGHPIPSDEENLVWKAIRKLRDRVEVPPLAVRLEKVIPIAAGLGGGSADAAAALVAGCDLSGSDRSLAHEVAPSVGADVTFPLYGGTAEMTGYGEMVSPVSPLTGFAVGVVVPDLELSTPDVYRRWDHLGGPEGFPVPDRLLPPPLRHGHPIRNDLYRAAVDLVPELGDFVADTARAWDTPVMMTGSGSACFGFFSTPDEADSAVSAIDGTRAARGAALRPDGVKTVEEEQI